MARHVLPPGAPDRPGVHFTWSEFCTSSHDVLLSPNLLHCGNMERLCEEVLDLLRERYNVPVFITSGYRSLELNKRIGGSKTSVHTLGLAADIKVGHRHTPTIPSSEVAAWLHTLPTVDQAIWYDPSRGGHVHVGLAPPGRSPRRQLLHAYAGGGYRPWSEAGS